MKMLDKTHRPAPPMPTARKDDPITVDFEERAKRSLREAMDANGLTIADLTNRLRGIGVKMSSGGVANKISRGGFSAAFYLMCMEAITSRATI